MNEHVGLRIPLTTPPKTKSQLKVELAEFGARHEHYVGDYAVDIHVWNSQDVTNALLNRIAPRGSDPREARMLRMIGSTNEYSDLNQNEKERLDDIVRRVAQSNDFIMCSCELVRGLAEHDLPKTKDPAIIDFYSFLFHHQTWTLTSMSDWPDTFDVRGNTEEVFCLVRDLNSPDLQDYNAELKKVDNDEDTPTLCTPAKEYDISPRDTSSWRRYLCTPWPIHENNNKNDTENYKWSVSTPTICNDSETYKALLRQVDDMKNYKNRLRNEVQRLTVALAQSNMKLKNKNKPTKETDSSFIH